MGLGASSSTSLLNGERSLSGLSEDRSGATWCQMTSGKLALRLVLRSLSALFAGPMANFDLQFSHRASFSPRANCAPRL